MSTKDLHCLDAILDAVDRIFAYTSAHTSAEAFNEDHKSFDACMMNFIVIGEMVEKLSTGFKTAHPEVEWLKIKGFRNLVAHDYFGIDAEEVWQIIVHRLPVLKDDIRRILQER
jgi:uncharacterized protein with HEPN domain